jgi:hypothetical protein
VLGAVLIQHDLIDELPMAMHPVVVGHPKRPSEETDARPNLTLVDTRTFDSGVVAPIYN